MTDYLKDETLECIAGKKEGAVDFQGVYYCCIPDLYCPNIDLSDYIDGDKNGVEFRAYKCNKYRDKSW